MTTNLTTNDAPDRGAALMPATPGEPPIAWRCDRCGARAMRWRRHGARYEARCLVHCEIEPLADARVQLETHDNPGVGR